MRTNLLAIVSDPKKYQQHFSAGFGLWLDNNWRKNGWDVDARNCAVETRVRAASFALARYAGPSSNDRFHGIL